MGIKLSKIQYMNPSGARSAVWSDVNRSEMAKKIGKSKSYVSKILSGKSHPSVDVLEQMSGLLGMTMEELNRRLKMIAVRVALRKHS